MAEVFGACAQPITEIGKCLCAPTARRINYARKLSKNWKALREKESELRDKRDDIVADIKRWKPQKIPTKECDSWRNKVAEMENKVMTKEQELSVKKKCIWGFCPHIFSRIKLGEEVVHMIGVIDELLVKSKFEQGYLVDSPPAVVEKLPEFDSTLASAYRTRDKVLEKIRDTTTPKIGIWGMGGVGKTTILKVLNNTPDIAKMFDFVIWVTVSKSPRITVIQKEVGERLSVSISETDSDDRVARKLLQGLDGKKYLLLLDDVWEMLDLAAVGLPNATQDNGCKVVLTTRNLGVCQEMGTDIDFKVEVLQEEEAWEMFCANVGDVMRVPDIKQLAESIVKECDGLPLALKVVSGALRKKANVSIWRNFLRELKAPAMSSIEVFNENVFKVLQVSYDQLKEIEKKQCLLFCGLYPEDSKIEKSELIGYWRAEGILSRELTLSQAQDKGDAIFEALIDASLLEKCDDDYHVKMHDVVRDLILVMTSPKGKETQHLVRAGISSEKIPNADEWKKATRISFMNHDLRHLPESPDCPELLTLLLQGNHELEVIPDSFFDKMPNLRVLDLSGTGIKSLPTSISKLDNLRELVLLGCYFLEALPKELSALKKLEVLYVGPPKGPPSDEPMTKFVVPAEMISRLPQIEVLEVSTLWMSDENTKIVTKELSKLSSLSSLEFNFRRVGDLQHFLENSRSWKEERLTQFRFFLLKNYIQGWLTCDWTQDKYNRCLIYEGGGEEERDSGLPSAIEDVLRRANWFGLKGHGKLNTLSEVGARNTDKLRHCMIQECSALEKIVNRKGLEMGVFPNLEALEMLRMQNLKTILCLEMEEGPLVPPSPNASSFTNLKTLILVDCSLIEQVFSSGFMVQQLSNLEKLHSSKCEGLKGMMIPDDQKIEYEALPKLRVLEILYSPEFVSFFEGVPMRWQSLEMVCIWDCPKLRRLPFDNNSAPNLKKIWGRQEWWDALEWDNDAIRLHFQPFFTTLSYYFTT